MGGFQSIQEIDRFLQGGHEADAAAKPAHAPTPAANVVAKPTHAALTPPPGEGPQFHSIADVDRFIKLNTEAQQPKQSPREERGEYNFAVQPLVKGASWLLEKDEGIKNWAVEHWTKRLDREQQASLQDINDTSARNWWRLLHPTAPLAEPTREDLDQLKAKAHATQTLRFGVERDLGRLAIGMVSDPMNWPFLLAGGPAVRPALRMGVDALFTIQQGVGAAQGLERAYAAGKKANWHVLSASPEATEFWQSVGDVGNQTLFASMGAKGAKEQMAAVRTWGEFNAKSKELFRKSWLDLDQGQKLRVMQSVQRGSGDKFYLLDPKGHTRGAYDTQEQAQAVAAKNPGWKVDRDPNRMHQIMAYGRQFGYHPGDADFNAAEAKYREATQSERQQMEEDHRRQREDVARRQTELEKFSQQVQQVDALIANAPEKAQRENSFEPPPILEGATPEERQSRRYSLESWREKIDAEKKRAALEADALRKRRAYAHDKLSAQLAKLGEVAIENQSSPEFAITDRRRIAHDPEAAEHAYHYMTAEMESIANAHMYVDVNDMLQALRTRRVRGTPQSGEPLSETEKAFLDMDRERKKIQQVGRGPIRGLSEEQKAEHAAQAIQLVERETTMREAAAALDREIEESGNPESTQRLQSERDEAQTLAEQARTERDQLAAAKAAQVAEEQSYAVGTPLTELKGKSGTIILADKRELPFHYAVVPMKQLITSHNPLRNFEANDEYPEPLQPRDYKSNQESQANVVADAGPERFKPSLLVSDDATAHGGPAVVRSDGVVAGGNGRTMRATLAYKTAAGEELYRALQEKAAQFGFDPAQLPPREEEPILVRVLDSDPTHAEELAMLGRDLNRPLTMGFAQAEEAVMAGKALDPETMNWVSDKLAGMEETASVRDLMRAYGNDIVAKMVASGMIDPSKRAEYITADGEMTEKAKDLFENAVWGKVIDDPELLATTPKWLLRKLDRSLAALFRVRSAEPNWDVIPEFNDALRLWKRIDSVAENLEDIGTKSDSQVDKYLRPETLPGGTAMLGFGGQQMREPPHPETEALAKLFEKSSLEIKKSLADYAADAEGTQMFLGPRPEPWESFNRAIAEKVGVEVPAAVWGMEKPKPAVTLNPTEEVPADISATKGGTETKVSDNTPERPSPQSFEPPPGPRFQYEAESNPVGQEVKHTLHALDQGKRVGAIELISKPGESSAWVVWAGLTDPYRGKQLGPELYRAAVDYAKQQGIAVLTSDVRGKTNQYAERVWKQLVKDGVAEETGEAKPKYRIEVAKADGAGIQVGKVARPPAVDTARAVEQIESSVTSREQLEGVLASHPGIGPEMAKTLTAAMDIVAKNAAGQSLDEFVKAHYASVSTQGEAGLGALFQGDPATYRGKDFWSGAVDPRDGKVVETHTREQAEAAKHHHFLYFDPETAAQISSGELRFFFMGKDGRPHVVDPWTVRTGSGRMPSAETLRLEREVEKQVKLKTAKAAQGERGATEFLADGRVLVHLYKTANSSTFLHEFLHTLVPFLKEGDLGALAKELRVAPELLKKTAPTAEERPAWKRAHETLASWWERYHRDATAPTPEVKGIFAKLHKAMREIYQSVKGSGLLKPSKSVSGLFDSWYGKHPEEAAKVEVESKPMLPREGAGEQSAQPSQAPVGTRDEAKPITGPVSITASRFTKKDLSFVETLNNPQAGQEPIADTYSIFENGFNGLHEIRDSKGGVWWRGKGLEEARRMLGLMQQHPDTFLGTSHVSHREPVPPGPPRIDINSAWAKITPETLEALQRWIDQHPEALKFAFSDAGRFTIEVPDGSELDLGAYGGKYQIVGWKEPGPVGGGYMGSTMPSAKVEKSIRTLVGRAKGEKRSKPEVERAAVQLEPSRAPSSGASITPPPAPEKPIEETLGEPLLTKAERATARRIATGGETITRKDDPVSRVFADQASAVEWAKTNRDKIKALELYETRDGKFYADFVAKDKNALFQEESIPDLNRRMQELEDRLRTPRLTEAERYRVGHALTSLEKKKAQILAQTPLFGRRELTPPPGAEIVLWTPEGEVREENRAPAQRREADAADGRKDAGRTGAATEPARPAPEPRLETAGGAVRTERAAGKAGARPAGSATALPHVPATRIDEPERPRGTPAYSASEWAEKVERLRLPPNAPIPSVKIPDSLRRMLVYAQPEVVEYALSGLAQHDAVILATSTGTGKTFMGAAILSQTARPEDFNLVITPSQSLIHGDAGWVSVGRDFGLNIHAFPEGREMPAEPGTYVVTWAKAREMENLKNHPWKMVLMDEVQEARGWYRPTKNGDLSRALGESAGKLVYISATPFHTPLEIGHMEKLGLWRKMGFDPWAEQFGITIDPATGQYRGTAAFRKLAKLREQMIERGQYINLDRIMDGYKSHIGVVPMSEETRQGVSSISRAFQMAQAYYEKKRNWGMVRNVKGLAMNYMKAYLERQRLPQAIELGKKLEKEGWKVIFFTETKAEVADMWKPLIRPDEEAFHGQIRQLLPPLPSVVDALKEAFGEENLANFSGPHTPQREAEKDAFLLNDKKHIYATYGAGGVGVSLHDTQGDAPRAVVYVGPPWSGMAFDQALGRPWRYGTKSNVNAHILISDSKPDVRLILQKVAPRLESLRAMVSGIHEGDAMTKSMRDIENALAFEFGNEDDSKLDEFAQKVEKSPIRHWTEIPVESAANAKNQGMKYPGEEAHPAVVKLFQDEYEPPVKGFTPEEVGEAQLYATDATERLAAGGLPPDTPGTSDPEVQKAIAAMAPAERKDQARAIGEQIRGALREPISTPKAEAQSKMRLALEELKNSQVGHDVAQLGEHGQWAGMGLKTVMLTHGREIIRQLGGNAGKEIADGMIPDYYERSGTIGGELAVKFFDFMTEHGFMTKKGAIKGGNLAGYERLVELVEGAAEPASEAEGKMRDQLRSLFNEARERLADEDVELELGNNRYLSFRNKQANPSYYPHFYPPDHWRDMHRKERAVKSMMESRGLTRPAAEDLLLTMGRDHPLQGQIEKPRSGDEPGYSKHPADLLRYATQFGEVISRTQVFGQRRGKLFGKIYDGIQDARDRQTVEAIMDQLLAPKHVHRWARGWQRFTTDAVVLLKMPFSMFPAFSQTVKAGMYANMRSLLQGLVKTGFNYEGSYRASLESGAILQGAWQKLLREMGGGGVAERALRWYGFHMAHLWGRMVADQTARVLIEKYALPNLLKDPQNSYWRRSLGEKFGLGKEQVDGAIQARRWQDRDYDTAAKRNAERTQFSYDQTEIPPGWSIDPKANPKTQFVEAFMQTTLLLQRTAFRNGVLLKDALYNEAKKGNFRPWLMFLAGVSLGDEVLADLYGIAHGDPKRIQQLTNPAYYGAKNLAVRELENLSFHGGLGMVKMVSEILKYHIPAWKAAAGPFFGDALSGVDLMLNDWVKDKDSKFSSAWHKRWMQTWRYMTHVYSPLRMAETAMGGPPGETGHEKQARERREAKRRREEIGPPPSGKMDEPPGLAY